jgi:hypothetical protein
LPKSKKDEEKKQPFALKSKNLLVPVPKWGTLVNADVTTRNQLNQQH